MIPTNRKHGSNDMRNNMSTQCDARKEKNVRKEATSIPIHTGKANNKADWWLPLPNMLSTKQC